MKLTFKKLALLGLSLFAMFVLVGCTDKTTGAETTIGLTDTQKVQAVLDGISLGDISAVDADLTLPLASVNGVSLSWSTNNDSYISALGEVTIPSFVDGNQVVKLTLTATLNSVSLTKDFNVTVSAETADQFLTRIANSIIITNSDSMIASFTLPSTLQGVTITWTSSNPTYAAVASAVDSAGLYKITVERPIIEDDGVNTTVTLTGTMTIGTVTKTITKDIRVLAMNKVEYMTIAEASQEEDDAPVMFKGIVTAVLGGSAFVQDETGGIYLYNVGSSNLSKLVVGNEVEVVGKIDIYSGFVEVIGLSKFEVLSTGNDLPDALDFDYVDIDELTSLQGNIVNMTQLKLKSLITTTSVGTSLYFFLTDGVNEIEMKVDKYTDDAIEGQIHTLLKSLTLDDTFKLVNVPIALNSGEAQFYLTSTSQLVKLSDAEKLAADKETLTTSLTNVSEGKQTLPLVGLGGSVISWVSDPTATINSTTGEITFPLVEEQTVFTLTATLTKGTLTAETKEFEVSITPMSAQDKFDGDLAAVTLALTATELDSVTLPILGEFGSTIAWEITSGTATLSVLGDKITYPFLEADQTVVLTATVSLGDLEDEKTFTVAVAALDLLTIAEFKLLPDNTVGAMKVILTGNTASHQWWLQDATGGINMYIPSALRPSFEVITWGSEIVIVGPQKLNYGMPQVNGISKYFVTDTAPALPTPVLLDDVAFENANLLPLVGQMVSFSGFTVKTLPTANNDGTYTFTLEDAANSKTINVRLDYRVIPEALYTAAEEQVLTFEVDDVVDVVGAFMSSYSSSYELAISLASHIVLHVDSPEEIAAADVAAITIDATVDAGEVVPLPSTSNTSTIVWSVGELVTSVSIEANVATFASVTETTVVTLIATFTYGTGEDAIETVEEYEVSIVVLSPEEKLAADKEDLTIALTATEISTVTLTTTTTFGSVVTWALTENDNASLAVNALSLDYLGSEYSVVVTANLALGELTASKEFTIVVSPLTVISDLSTLTAKDTGAWVIANDTDVYVKGVIVQKYYTSGYFLQDANGKGIYVKGTTESVVGDEVIVFAKTSQETSTYVEGKQVRLLISSVPKYEFPVQKTVIPTTLTVEQLAATIDTYYLYAGMMVTVENIKVKEYTSTHVDLYWSEVDNYTLSFKFSSDYPWMPDLYEAGDLIPEITFVIYNMYNATEYNILPAPSFVLTEQQTVDMNKELLPESLILTEDYVIPTAKYDATIAITTISSELTDYLTAVGVVTLPDVDAVGTITFTVTKGSVSDTVTIPVTVKALSDAEKLALAVAEIPSSLLLANTYNFEELLFSSQIDSITIPVELQANISHLAGEMSIVRPAIGQAALLGTIRVNVSLGTETSFKDILVTVKPYSSDLLISYYMEGDGGNKKILAAYNDTGADIDLSKYKLGFFGNPTADPVASAITGPALTGTLAHGKSVIIYHGELVDPLKTASYVVTFATDIASIPAGNITVAYSLSFNGEKGDIIALVKNVEGTWTFIDVMGLYEGPLSTGSREWETSYTKNKTLIRDIDVISPTATVNWDQWTVNAANYYSSKVISWY